MARVRALQQFHRLLGGCYCYIVVEDIAVDRTIGSWGLLALALVLVLWLALVLVPLAI